MSGIFEELKVKYCNKSEILEDFLKDNPEYKGKNLKVIIHEQALYVYHDKKMVYNIVADKGTMFKESGRIYGYARVSTMKQSIKRQIDNIKSSYPDAVIISESFTGTKMDRPNWKKLEKTLKDGDTVVFDEVSRMSRNAEEGFQTYKALYEKGVNLIFLKESTLNTDNFRKTAQIAMTGEDVDCILKGINEYLMILAENQIKTAFETAQHEVDFLHKRTSEGVRRAQAEGKQVGILKGQKLITKKSIKAKDIIQKHCKDFGGTLSDTDTMKLAGLARNTYYKYKKALKKDAYSF